MLLCLLLFVSCYFFAFFILLCKVYSIQFGLLTSIEIVGSREEYGLTSEEFSKILGFKEDRIKRLEAKVIQDKETDQLIRRFHTDKDFAADLVQISVNALPEGKSEEVLKKLKK